MKHSLSILLSAVLLLHLLSACGEQPEPSPSTDTDEPSVSQTASPSQPEPAAVPEYSAAGLAELVLPYAACEDPEALEFLSPGADGERLNLYLDKAYGLAVEPLVDCAVYRATGASAFELAVLRFADENTASSAVETLEDYRDSREGDFTGYAPAQADMVHDGAVRQNGVWVGLFLCPDSGAVASAFAAALEGRELPQAPDMPEPSPSQVSGQASGGEQPDDTAGPSQSPEPESSAEPEPGTQPEASAEPAYVPEITPTFAMINSPPLQGPADPNYPDRIQFIEPGDEDMTIYDTSAIRAAWDQGDPSGLSDYDQAIYNAAKAVLDQVLRPGMTDYDKEVALYAWLVQNVDYDWRHNNIMAATPRESYTPYGPLVERTAVCLGYATAFQLLMDLAGVECVTVTGAASENDGDHAWNMVRLDGNWYGVDATWDANYREDGFSDGWTWFFFNVTSDYLAQTNHQWDYSSVPEAVTEGHGA